MGMGLVGLVGPKVVVVSGLVGLVGPGVVVSGLVGLVIPGMAARFSASRRPYLETPPSPPRRLG